MNCSEGSVTVPPAALDTGKPSVELLPAPSAVELTEALFARPVVDTLIASPLFAFTQTLRSVSLRSARVFVYVQTTSASGIVNVVFGPGVDDDGVAPVQATVVA